ncbi:MAG: endonuclease III [Phycisphaerales bacterium]|jgi:endonuclease-3|nr:endonuclease III [Phycisphaerales bacterium]
MSDGRSARRKPEPAKATAKPRRSTRASARPKAPTSSRRAPSKRKAIKASRPSPKPNAAQPDISPVERLRALRLLAALRADYPDAHCELVFSNPHELLVATILSAQATDASVNKATPALFARFPSPAAYAAASPQEIEPYIKSIGLFRNKARAVHESMTAIRDRFGGQVPRTMQELLTLRGVARKTANVVLGNCFNINDGVVVDTHVQRLARRFALAPADASVADIEQRLMQLFPRDSWCLLSHLLIFHGRRACKARGVRGDSHPICRDFGVACECRK